MKRELQVAAAVIYDPAGRVLITRRPAHVHQGGRWEFPGGKLESGESVEHGLARELEEELGIRVTRAEPLIRLPYEYPEHRVVLDVWRVMGFDGQAHGREGQPLAWVAPECLSDYEFPPANLPIITAAQLPDRYLITPEPDSGIPGFLARLERVLAKGIRLVQLRCNSLDETSYIALARQAARLCARYQARLMLNGVPELLTQVAAHGVHLSSARLRAYQSRPIAADKWLAASCHTADDMRHAAAIGADFIVVSPVLPTASHPGAPSLGWAALREFTELACVPVYALGGMEAQHLPQAKACGAQGIAAIRGLWD